jgi:tetratricopeptide (TPR) repeat protein
VPDTDAPSVGRPDVKPARSLCVRFVRELCGIEQEELADRSGFEVSTVRYWERGKREPGLENVERLMDALQVSTATTEELLALAEEIRGGPAQDAWVGPVLLSGTRLQRAREFGRKAGDLEARNFQDFILRAWVEEQARKDRETAEQIGIYLRGFGKDLVERVRRDPGCHLWSCAEWLCMESMDVISKDRDSAARHAEAALVVAELANCDERFRARLLGYCWGHLGNVLRVKCEFEEADATFARCFALWQGGAVGDPYGVLDAGRLMGMEASLRREQGRFTEALRLLKEALPIATSSELPYLRVNCGIVLEQMGDSESAIRVLEEAAQQAPRHLLFYARLAVGVNLCALGRLDEAEALVPEVARLAIETESKANLTRVRWLSGRLASRRGRTEQALGLFKSVQREFLEQGSAYDAVVAALDLAKIYLEQGEAGTVKRLAEEMAPIFVDKGVHHHAQKALELFAAAAVREAASVELVRRLVKYLERARRSHGLSFDVIGE